MSNDWLQTFICVCKTQSVSKAADILYLSAPTVSSRIAQLEHDLGEPLFMRVGKKMILNEAGARFLPYAERILKEWNESRQSLYELKNVVKGTLGVALFYAIIPLFTPHFISFGQAYPEVKLSIKTMHADEIISHLQSNIVQVGIVRKTDDPMMSSIHLMDDNFVLVVYPGHPFAATNRFTLEALKSERIIFLNSGVVYKEVIGKYMNPKLLESLIFAESDNVEVCKHYVLAGEGIAFMPLFAVRKEINEGLLHALTLEDDLVKDIDRSVNLIWMKQSSNYLVSIFVDHLKERFGAARPS